MLPSDGFLGVCLTLVYGCDEQFVIVSTDIAVDLFFGPNSSGPVDLLEFLRPPGWIVRDGPQSGQFMAGSGYTGDWNCFFASFLMSARSLQSMLSSDEFLDVSFVSCTCKVLAGRLRSVSPRVRFSRVCFLCLRV